MATAKSVARSGVARKPPTSSFWNEILRRKKPLASIERLGTLERIQMIEEGVPSDLLDVIATDMGIARDALYKIIALPRSTANRKLSTHARLNRDESERVLGVAVLIGLVDRIVRESGNPEGFDAAQWAARWLDSRIPALGGKRPADFMGTAEGRSVVTSVINAMQSGAYM